MKTKFIFTFFLWVLVCLTLVHCTRSGKEFNQVDLADQMEVLLTKGLLEVWYPASVDSDYGGFITDMTYDWEPEGKQDRSLVYQARHIWTCSEASNFLGDTNYLKIAKHGINSLQKNLHDSLSGGFHEATSRDWNLPNEEKGTIKSAYGHAFVIYALASYFESSGDINALELAQKTFYWLEKHSHDPVNKGYFDLMNADGTWEFENRQNDPTIINRASWKDMNSSIHLMEAFTELYSVWPDSLLRVRLEELFYLIRDSIIQPEGYMDLHFTRDWHPVSFRDSSTSYIVQNFHYDHVSFGHDMETAFLLLEAAHVLHFTDDPATLQIVKKLVDHSVASGWDNSNGGFYYGGYYFADSTGISIVDESKQWWVQAESMNTLLLMSKFFPDETIYQELFMKQWEYVNNYCIDHDYGGWYHLGLDNYPEGKKAPKANIWKANYHTSRTLINCIRILRNEYELLVAINQL